MTDDAKQKRAEQERNWLAKMEWLGPDVVRSRFADRRPVTDIAPYPDAEFVEGWLGRKKRAAAIRSAWLYAIPFSVSVIAAVAACIAAWPVLKEWFGR